MFNERYRNSFLAKAIRFTGRYIDYPTAFAGALVMGIIVGVINRKFGWWPATTAAMKQSAYTFLFGGMMIKLLYAIVLAVPGRVSALILSVFIVSVLTIILVYLLHNLRGTPMPFESTLPTIILAPPGFFFLAFRKKK